MYALDILTALLITPMLAMPVTSSTALESTTPVAATASPEASDCTNVRIRWQNKTGGSVLVTGYEVVFAGKVFSRVPKADGGVFEAKAGETWTSGEYLFEGAQNMDATHVNVLYRRWAPGQGGWSANTFRAKLTPGHPTCTDGKIYQTVQLTTSDNVVGG